ncbi:MAG TPA: hypothetical protein PLF40_05050 [Kofleriaceae bacterium]|jgi:hypothetical protein|nr:hypothetical protein [Kofleriaceae bacterium]
MIRFVTSLVWVAPLSLAACSFAANSAADATVKKDAVTVDAAIDAPGNCTPTCSGNKVVCGVAETVCPLTCSATGGAHCTQYTPSNGATLADLDTIVDGSGDLVVAAALRINSDNGEIKDVAQNTTRRTAGEGVENGIRFRAISNSIALLAFDDFSIDSGGSVRVIGNRALIILARNNITLMGEVDIDGGRAADNSANGAGGGAGAVGASAATGCSAGQNGGNNNGFGGGAGGAFGLASGKGGSNLGGASSPRCMALLRDNLQGGSGGGRGGDTDTGGAGGGGGGAIQFSALLSIQVGAQVGALLHANGSGGQAKQADKRGGGGGGAGGGFLFEAPSVTIAANAIVVANGGAGGDGKDTPNGDGQPGQRDTTDAKGGGNGGNGGSVASPANNGTGNANDGGGGGGASVGKIEVRAGNAGPVNANAIVSPTPAVNVLTGI